MLRELGTRGEDDTAGAEARVAIPVLRGEADQADQLLRARPARPQYRQRDGRPVGSRTTSITTARTRNRNAATTAAGTTACRVSRDRPTVGEMPL